MTLPPPLHPEYHWKSTRLRQSLRQVTRNVAPDASPDCVCVCVCERERESIEYYSVWNSGYAVGSLLGTDSEVFQVSTATQRQRPQAIFPGAVIHTPQSKQGFLFCSLCFFTLIPAQYHTKWGGFRRALDEDQQHVLGAMVLCCCYLVSQTRKLPEHAMLELTLKAFGGNGALRPDRPHTYTHTHAHAHTHTHTHTLNTIVDDCVVCSDCI